MRSYTSAKVSQTSSPRMSWVGRRLAYWERTAIGRLTKWNWSADVRYGLFLTPIAAAHASESISWINSAKQALRAASRLFHQNVMTSTTSSSKIYLRAELE